MPEKGGIVGIKRYPDYKESRTFRFILPLPLVLKTRQTVDNVVPLGMRKTNASIFFVADVGGRKQEVDFNEMQGLDVLWSESTGPYLRFEYFKTLPDDAKTHIKDNQWEGKAREIIPVALKKGIAPTHRAPVVLGDQQDDLWVMGYAKEDWEVIAPILKPQAEGKSLSKKQRELLKSKTKAFPFSRIRNFETKKPAYLSSFISVPDAMLRDSRYI